VVYLLLFFWTKVGCLLLFLQAQFPSVVSCHGSDSVAATCNWAPLTIQALVVTLLVYTNNEIARFVESFAQIPGRDFGSSTCPHGIFTLAPLLAIVGVSGCAAAPALSFGTVDGVGPVVTTVWNGIVVLLCLALSVILAMPPPKSRTTQQLVSSQGESSEHSVDQEGIARQSPVGDPAAVLESNQALQDSSQATPENSQTPT